MINFMDKQCSKCQAIKNSHEFGKNGRVCKVCKNIISPGIYYKKGIGFIENTLIEKSGDSIINMMIKLSMELINNPNSPWFNCNIMNNELVAETRTLTPQNIEEKTYELDNLFSIKISNCEDRCCEIPDIDKQYITLVETSAKLEDLISKFDYGPYIKIFYNEIID